MTGAMDFHYAQRITMLFDSYLLGIDPMTNVIHCKPGIDEQINWHSRTSASAAQ